MLLDDILSGVMKPGRYIGREWNAVEKDFSAANIKFALCFPDLYEVGMSNLGMRIIYGILNNITDVSCERFFAPGLDLEANLRSKNKKIFSLESKKNLDQFDIVGFSLGYELSYTNILNVLDLGSIPLKSSLRDHNYPLVIGGGPCVFNPEPLHDFFDLFIIGEAEDAVVELINAYRKLKDEFRVFRMDKNDLLVELSRIEGVYVPSLYEIRYDSCGRIAEFKPRVSGIPLKIKKRIVKDFDRAYFPSKWLVPFIQTVHDRITLEVMRGCPNRCRFCQARQQYFPFRKKSAENILNNAIESSRHSGYEEIALAGLSVSDYPGIEGLLKTLIDYFKDKCVSISLPSIKPRSLLGGLWSLIATIKKTGLTFAPEAATARLRGILGKDFNREEFLRLMEQAFLSGYRHLKLYFMIGLPGEKKEDLDGIVDFAFEISELRRKIKRPPAEVNLSINTLIPKPHTPFQWLEMQDLNGIKAKQDYLRKRIKVNRRIKINFHNCNMSLLEGVFSRGDRRLSQVIVNAFNAGARFDGWQEYFKFEIWKEAFAACGIEPEFYLRQKQKDEFLPWDFLDAGISKEALLREFNVAIEQDKMYNLCI